MKYITKRVFLIRGWGGFPEEGWRPWLKNELEKRGFAVSVPAMPDSEHPRMAAWLKQLKDTVGEPDKNCYFVSHSLGCVTILRYLEALEDGQNIGGAVLVAGFTDMKITVAEDEDIRELSTFFEREINFNEIKKRCGKFVAIHSDNDPFVDLRYAEIFQEKLGAKIVREKARGHFSGDDGVRELPSALESVLQLVS
ncbi:MAG: alpha/beta hydrolase [bacterium]